MNYRLIKYYAGKFPPYVRRDMFQEGCLACLLGRDPYHGMVDAFRKQTHFKRYGEQYTQIDFSPNEFGVDPDIIDAIFLKEAKPLLYHIVSELKPRWQELLYLRYWEGLFLGEIAVRFGNTESAVSYMHKKILEKLKARWESIGGRS